MKLKPSETSIICGTTIMCLALTGLLPGLEGSAAGAQPSVSRRCLAGTKGAEELHKKTQSFLLSIPSENDIPELAALLENFHALPRRQVTISTWNNDKRVDLSVTQVGYGTNDTVFLALHGVLSDHENWRYLVGALGGRFDYWLVDLPGCGLSQKPSPARLGEHGYAPEAIADRVWQALQPMLEQRQNQVRIILAGHSLGGMVAVRMLGDPALREKYAQPRQQVMSLVLFAPCDPAVGIEIKTFVEIADLKPWKISVGDALGLVRNKVAHADHDSFCNSNFATRESAENLLRAFLDGDRFRASQAMIRQAIPGWDKSRKPDWNAIQRLVGQYDNVDVPCLIIWGERDETFPEWMGHKIKDHIRGSILKELPYCKHSAMLERPRTCAELIIEFNQESEPTRDLAQANTR
jgi:2-hydroxy-6-oxonona-2,4-dienedioate hydrolase